MGLAPWVAVDSKMARRVADRREDWQGSPGTEPGTAKECVCVCVLLVVLMLSK